VAPSGPAAVDAPSGHRVTAWVQRAASRPDPLTTLDAIVIDHVATSDTPSAQRPPRRRSPALRVV
jgi:hypothetical protein